MKSYTIKLLLIFFVLPLGCTKLVQIQPPTSTITTSQVFRDSADAAAAVSGIYSSMAYKNSGFANSEMTIYPGLSADELLTFGTGGGLPAMTTNTLLANNGFTPIFWTQGYSYLYQANAVIDGLQTFKIVSETVKNEFVGEAKWFRAFLNFYLVNLFGDIPLINSIDFKSNALAARTPTAQVYQSIISDLIDAQNLLPSDYSEGGGERIRANRWAATALLARVYLYKGDYPNAEIQATAIIGNSGLYSLDSLNGVFLKNSKEAILQWQNNSHVNTNTYNATYEGYQLIPFDATSPPKDYLSSQLLTGFEDGDLRKTTWIDSTVYSGVTYYYPYKYKVGTAQAASNAPVTQYYTVLRLAEQYLIRAEARAQLNETGAIADLNVIRERAGLTDLSASLNPVQVLAAVAQERRIELFAEWGHRWFDLKRTGQIGNAFSTVPYKSAYKSYQQLYPIPQSELQSDPNLTQNPGY